MPLTSRAACIATIALLQAFPFFPGYTAVGFQLSERTHVMSKELHAQLERRRRAHRKVPSTSSVSVLFAGPNANPPHYLLLGGELSMQKVILSTCLVVCNGSRVNVNVCTRKVERQQEHAETLKISFRQLSTAFLNTISDLGVPFTCQMLQRSQFKNSLLASPACHFPSAQNPGPCSAVATLMPLTTGGGERYLFMMAYGLQKMGHNVDINVLSNQPCYNTTCAAAVADSVGVPIDWTRANIRIHADDWAFQAERLAVTAALSSKDVASLIRKPYSVLAFLGNHMTPELTNVEAQVGVYMCQFPFDQQTRFRTQAFIRLGTYDTVLFNSRYSLQWYEQYLAKAVSNSKASKNVYRGPLPTRVVAYPGVPLHQRTRSDLILRRRPVILMVGRFFTGRQSKRQLEAVAAFKELKQMLAGSDIQPQLLLVGALLNVSYSKRVLEAARLVGGIEVLHDLDRESLKSATRKASVVWSLTGYNGSAFDAADSEHFGISVVEAMSAGCVPVLAARGAVKELVPHQGIGFLASSLTELAVMTKRVLELAPNLVNPLRSAASNHTSQFSDSHFLDLFQELLKSTVSLPQLWSPFSDIARANPIVKLRENKYRAIIVDTRRDLLLPLVIRHTMTMLPPDWGLFLYASSRNEMFLRDALNRTVRNFTLTLLESAGNLNDSSYNHLLKSTSFWKAHLDCDRVLVFQLDSIILRSDVLDYFLKWSYIGAPWTSDNDVYKGVNEAGVAIPPLDRSMRVGNGGLSLRSPAAMLQVLRAHGASSEDSEQEDVFFVRHLASMNFSVADLSSGLRFSLEVPIRELTTHLKQGHMYGPAVPFALHQSWKYTLVETVDGLRVGPPMWPLFPGAGSELIHQLVQRMKKPITKMRSFE